MAEKRKPSFIFLLKKSGIKTAKLELFPAKLWHGPGCKYRLRLHGKWIGNKHAFFTKYEVRDLIWRSLTKVI